MSEFVEAVPHRTRIAVGLLVILPAALLITFVPLRGLGLSSAFWGLCLVAAVAGLVVGYVRRQPDEDPVSDRSAAIAVAVVVPVWAGVTLAAGVGEFGLVAGPVFVFFDLMLVAMSVRVLRSDRG